MVVDYPITNTINHKPDNGCYGYCPGLDNAFICAIDNNTIQPLLSSAIIINGRRIKSVNQYSKILANSPSMVNLHLVDTDKLTLIKIEIITTCLKAGQIET